MSKNTPEVPVTKDPAFVMGNPRAGIWTVVVQHEKDGEVVGKELTEGLELLAALDKAADLRQSYRTQGYLYVEQEGRFLDREKKGECFFIFVM